MAEAGSAERGNGVLELPHHGRDRPCDGGAGAMVHWSRAGAAACSNRAWLHRAAILMGPSGFVAVLAGWITTEVGRQPYTVYGLLRTADSASPIEAPAVAASLIAFIVVYFILFGAGTFYLLQLM